MRGVETNMGRLGVVVDAALSAYEVGGFPFDQPHHEEKFVSLAKEVGIQIKNGAFAANALFLVSTLIFGSRTKVILDHVSESHELLVENAWLFDPAKFIYQWFARGEDSVSIDLARFIRAPGYTANSLGRAWIYNCFYIHFKHDGDIRKLFQAGLSDQQLMKELTVFTTAKTPRKIDEKAPLRFGDKLAELFKQWAVKYELVVADQFVPPIDRHVSHIAWLTGVMVLDQEVNTRQFTDELRATYRILLAHTNQNPREISEAMFTIGSELCAKGLHDQCPLARYCTKQTLNLGYWWDDLGKFPPNTEAD